jgi:spermidine synthase
MARRVPIIYSGISFLIAFAVSMAISGWFRQFTLLQGNHMKSVLVILSQAFICLALGAWIFGVVADKVKNPLYTYFIIVSISTLYIFFQQPLFRIITDYNNIIVNKLIPLILLFIPLSFISGTLPLLSRYYIRNINHAGILMSNALFSLSAGIVTAVMIAVLFLVPSYGINSLHITAGISLLASLALVLFTLLKNDKTGQSPALRSNATLIKNPIRFRRKRIVLETGAKLTRAMLYGSVFQAFSFSSMLIIYLRLLIKYNYLNPVFFYSVVLITIFTGVAAGTVLYGTIADKPANKYLTLAILQIIAGISSLLSFALQQFLAPDIFEGISKGSGIWELAFHHVVLFSLLVFIPSVIHGMSLPLAGRLYPKRLAHIGKTFGKLTSFVLLSLLAGIIFTSLILIPLIGIHASFIFLSLLIVLSGTYLIVRDSRLIRGFRFAFAFSALLVFMLILVALRMLNISQHNRASEGLYEGSTSSVSLIQNHDSASKSVFINGDYFFGTDDVSLIEQNLSAYIPLLIRPETKSAYVIGFGTGITASILEKSGVTEILITETSPELIRLSSSVFSDENSDVLTEAAVSIRVIDPRTGLLKTGAFDLILSGSEQLLLYPGRYTKDFLKLCYNNLSDNGLYCQVLQYERIDSIVTMTIYKGCAEIFEHVSMWYLSPGRLLIVGSKNAQTPEYCQVNRSFELHQNDFEKIGISEVDEFLAHFLFRGDPFSIENVPENTDLHPQLEFRHSFDEFASGSLNYLVTFVNPGKSFFISDSCTYRHDQILSKIASFNRLLLRDVSPSYSISRHVTDSSLMNGSPFLQYP